MKRVIYQFFFYIGLFITIFNPHPLYADEIDYLSAIESLTQTENIDENRPLIQSDNEFLKLYITLQLVDKIYKDSDINKDIKGFLKRVWPSTKDETLVKIEPFFKAFVMLKRRYVYVTEKLQQQINAYNLLPEDAPVIAKDGDFAPENSNKRKETPSNQYKVSYTPYKYIGYDSGKEGDPVRRRDKNYEPVKENVLAEITLALLKLDIGAFYQALKKLPEDNDGSREKTVELENGLRSRLLSASLYLGNDETINTVLEVYLPKGWYINGDYLNPITKPKFYLSEDSKEDLNIKDYQVYHPLTIGVTHDNITERILVDDVKFPIQFKRRDLNKDVNIRGTFVFEACRAKKTDCRMVKSTNSLTIKSSYKSLYSNHENFVTQAFAHLPPIQSEHAKIKEVIYYPKSSILSVKFDTTKTFSNIATQVEDAFKTDFMDPRYIINNNETTAIFKVQPNTIEKEKYEALSEFKHNIENGGEIAISAAFNEKESLRTVIKPTISYDKISTLPLPKPDYKKAFIFGLMLNLMPGLFYLLQRLFILFYERQDRIKIFIRYLIGSALGLLYLLTYTASNPWYGMYENTTLMTLVIMLSTSYVVILTKNINLDLFRPLHGYIKRGFLIGLFSVLMMVASPLIYLKTEVMNNINYQSVFSMYKLYTMIFLGLITLPTLGLIAYRYILTTAIKMHYINKAYTLLYLLSLIWIIYTSRGLMALIWLIPFIIIISALWYIYPKAITISIKQGRKENFKKEIFKTIQNHMSIAIAIIILLNISILKLYPVLHQNLPTISSIQTKADTITNQGKALLVSINAYWSPESIANKPIFKNLKLKNVEIIDLKITTKTNNFKDWTLTYGTTDIPLNILFTSRHPNGLVLPKNLKDIDFNKALADFTSNTTNQQNKDIQ